MANIDQVPQIFFFSCKGQTVKLFSFENLKVSIVASQLLYCNKKLAKDNV